MDLYQAGNERRNALTRYYIQRYIRLMIDKNMSMRKKKQDEVFLLAEGIIDGK